MVRPRVYKTEAIVLKKINLGEADNIVTLYTPNFGKIRAVAKGVRRPKSKLGGHIELLTQSTFLLAQGRNLDIITQSQTIESFLPLRTNLWRTGCAIYIAELVDQFTVEQVENYPVYRLLQNSLNWLCVARNSQIALRYFELNLLSQLGYLPELYVCPNCRSQLTPRMNLFSATDGGVICSDCAKAKTMVRPLTVDALKIMRFLLANDHISANRLRISSNVSRELEETLRGYIRSLLERDVKSAGFLDHLQREGAFCELDEYDAGQLWRVTT